MIYDIHHLMVIHIHAKYHKSMSKDKKVTVRIQKCKKQQQLFDLEI